MSLTMSTGRLRPVDRGCLLLPGTWSNFVTVRGTCCSALNSNFALCISEMVADFLLCFFYNNLNLYAQKRNISKKKKKTRYLEVNN